MSSVESIKKAIICAACLALSVVVTQLLRFIPRSGAWCAVAQLSVLLCALRCGWKWGLLCGLCAPVLTWLLCAAPSVAFLPMLLVECAVIGLAGGALMAKLSRADKESALFKSFLSALLLGRILGGVMGGLLYGPGLEGLLFWCISYLAAGLPALIIVLVLVPKLYAVIKDI